jgi:Flp pilus assembly protein TadG
MLSTIRRIMTGLKASTSGNATLLVALGMPVLIGGSGLAVDSAQYYMWKRDLQFAVDQAALAGAWARTKSSTQSTYQARALQEYNANLQATGSFDSGPTTTLTNYGTGTNNAVRVVATASKALPFSRIIMGRSVTVRVQATAYSVAGQAAVSTTTTLSALGACLIALNPTAQGAFTLGGNASGSVSCGGAALSNDPNAAIEENGNPSTLFSTLTATGGIESSLLNNVVGARPANLAPNTTGLVNPYAATTNPTGSGVARTYVCPTATAGSPAVTTYTATQKIRTVITYNYKKGRDAATASAWTYTSGTGYLANSDNNPGVTTSVSRTTSAYVASGPTQAGPSVGTAVVATGSGNNTIWRIPTTTTYTTISNVGSTVTPAVPANDGIARPQPGTYSSIAIGCTTIFQPGIFVINGSIDFSQNQTVSGTDMMIVMTNANQISNINSNTNLNLTGISSSTLTGTYGYTAANAAKFANVLFWDPNSTDEIKFNGNSTTAFNGIIYTPNRHLWFNGTSAVSGKCMMLVADRLTFNGTTDLASFCTPSGGSSPVVRPETTTTTVTTQAVAATVKLVA